MLHLFFSLTNRSPIIISLSLSPLCSLFQPDHVNKGSPIIVLHFMCQQINCVRKKSDGEIVEGNEDDIRANSYVAAFQREHDEEKGELNWKIVDFRFNGAIAYL
jgi:import inner membrane translocase subunit TIM44